MTRIAGHDKWRAFGELGEMKNKAAQAGKMMEGKSELRKTFTVSL